MNEYLERIGIDRDGLAVDLSTLNLLQRQHLLSVPFENLDIHWRRPIMLDTATFYDKIVVNRRGGFCYELNGLFGELLRFLGFETRLVSARVVRDDGSMGPDFDHAALIVSIGGAEYLADVGFGDFATLPLKLAVQDEQHDPAGSFRIQPLDGGNLEVAKREKENWRGQYIFNDIRRDLNEFAAMCDFQQYSPESHFTKGRVCSLLTQGGRKTLTDTKFIVTDQGRRSEVPISGDHAFYKVLMSEFQIAGPAATQ